MSDYGTATYSPDDNKIRMTPFARLSKEDYDRIRAAGFIWAPKQELFVAPMWTPDREDLMIEWCSEIGDEDTSLVDRAEVRAERFDGYSERRADDAERAREGVVAIADGIPLGQPILVGHHSEKHARRDAERIESGMRRSVKMWETSKYWTARAAGALSHAKYLERPDVRARRIKKIEAAKRAQDRLTATADKFLKLWNASGIELTHARAVAIANSGECHISQRFPLKDYPRELPASQYEGDMGLWSALTGGVINAEQARAIATRQHELGNARRARWIAHYDNRLAYERAMLNAAGGTVTQKTGPEVGGACKCWYNRGWSKIQKVNKVSVTVLDNWGNSGPDFTRTIAFDKLAGVMTKAQVDLARLMKQIFAEDSRSFMMADKATEPKLQAAADPMEADMKAMKQTLKAGVQVVSANQLFPTPKKLAKQLVELADIQEGHRILEPSAGTGSLLMAVYESQPLSRWPAIRVVAVEINRDLSKRLDQYAHAADVHCMDFMTCTDAMGQFDRIVMNPPFENGLDIKHILHAVTFLKPGGRLVAICANGPRQHRDIKPLCDQWIDLPAGSFESQGTGVNTAMIVINR